LKQIDGYNWISEKIANDCIERLESIIGIEMEGENPQVLPEHIIIHHSMEEQHAKIDQVLAPHFPENMRFRFSAIVDLLTDASIWELKCTGEISMDHKLQVCIYAWLWEMMDKPARDFKIMNIITGEILIMNYEPDELSQIVIALLKGRYENLAIKTDEEFIHNCRKYI
jgi:hypothetical protein